VRLELDRSGPWIGVAGLFVLLWIAIASSRVAPWWGVLIEVAVLVPQALLVARWAGPHPRRALAVPFAGLVLWILLTIVGVRVLGWD